VQARRLAAFFDTSTWSVTHAGAEKFPRKAMCVSVFISRKLPKAAGHQCVNEEQCRSQSLNFDAKATNPCQN